MAHNACMIWFLKVYPHLMPFLPLAHYIQNVLTRQHCSSLSGEHLLIITCITVIYPQIK